MEIEYHPEAEDEAADAFLGTFVLSVGAAFAHAANYARPSDFAQVAQALLSPLSRLTD